MTKKPQLKAKKMTDWIKKAVSNYVQPERNQV